MTEKNIAGLTLWWVKIPTMQFGNIFNQYRVMTYYVHARDAIEAEEEAQEMLPDNFEIVSEDFITEKYILNKPEFPAFIERAPEAPARRVRAPQFGGLAPSRIIHRDAKTVITTDEFTRMFGNQRG